MQVHGRKPAWYSTQYRTSLGNYKVITSLGDYEVITSLGNYKVITSLGNYKVITSLGDYEVITSLGNYEAITSFGNYRYEVIASISTELLHALEGILIQKQQLKVDNR